MLEEEKSQKISAEGKIKAQTLSKIVLNIPQNTVKNGQETLVGQTKVMVTDESDSSCY